MLQKKYSVLSLIILVGLTLTACGGQAAVAEPQTLVTTAPQVDATEAPAEETDQPEGTLPMVDPLSVSGDVVTAGSSTVYPLAEAMAARFEDEGYSGQITIDSIGSGGGFERFCVTGETDVSNASRPIKDSEIESCASIGRTPIEFRVGTDALAVTVSQENDFLTSVTFEELAAIFSTAETWADVNPDWPAEPIVRYIPGTDSGTFDFFVEEVFDEDEKPILSASELNLSEDDNVLVQGILGSPYAIGFFGYAYYAENADTLTVLSIENVEPSAATVDSNEYPLARPLFIYSDASIMQEKPQVAAYINFFLTYVNEEIVDVGYFPASDAALESSAKQLAGRSPISVILFIKINPNLAGSTREIKNILLCSRRTISTGNKEKIYDHQDR